MEQNIEPKKISVARNAMNYGALLGVVQIVLSLVFYILNLSTSTFVFWLQLIVMLSGIIVGILFYRNKISGGYISYGKSLGSGMLIGFFASFLIGIYVYLFYIFIDPASVNQLIAIKEQDILKQNPEISDEQLEMSIDMMRKFMTPLWMGIWSIVMNAVYAFLASLIISIFTRKADKSFEANFR